MRQGITQFQTGFAVLMFLFVCHIFLNTHTYFILIVEAFASLLRPHQQLMCLVADEAS